MINSALRQAIYPFALVCYWKITEAHRMQDSCGIITKGQGEVSDNTYTHAAVVSSFLLCLYCANS